MMVLMISGKRYDRPHHIVAFHDIPALEVMAISAQGEFLELTLKDEDLSRNFRSDSPIPTCLMNRTALPHQG